MGTRHQYVDVPRSTALDVNRYTLSAWVRYTGVENDLTLGRWEVLEKAGAYWMNVRTDGRVRVGGFYGGCTNPSWQFLDSTVALPTGRWKHVASTYDGTTLRVFVDGRAVGSKRGERTHLRQHRAARRRRQEQPDQGAARGVLGRPPGRRPGLRPRPHARGGAAAGRRP